MTASSASELDAQFRGAKVLITGGFGLIGSTLAHRLVGAGAVVRLLDNLDPEFGAHRANIEGIEDRIEIVIADLRDADAVRARRGRS